MKFFKSLWDVCLAAVEASQKNPMNHVGIFQRIDTNEYYFSYDSREIRAVDECLGQYLNGELLNNSPVS